MGQYFIVVNKSKQEMLTPHTFGDFSKLREFGDSKEGTMLGLAALLGQHSDADFCVHYDAKKHGTQWEKQRDGSLKHVPPKESLDADPEGKICGRWFGDKIAFPGEYGMSGEGLTKADVRKFERERPIDNRTTNLYCFALAYYKDISGEVLDLLAKCGHGVRASGPQDWLEKLDDILTQMLRYSYPMPKDMFMDLRWLTLEYLDNLVHKIKTKAQWAALKEFLLARKLPPPLVKALGTYRFDKNGEFEDWTESRASIQIDMDLWCRKNRNPHLLLPDAQHLAAALHVQSFADQVPMGPKKAPAGVSDIATQAGTSMRSRAIDLQTKHAKK